MSFFKTHFYFYINMVLYIYRMINMKKKRKSVKRKLKRRRLRVKRLLICILVFISFIFLIVFGVKFMFNSKKYKSITETNSVRLYLKKFNVWEKTIDYIKENGEDITFNMGKYKVVMPAKNITSRGLSWSARTRR